MNRSGLKFNRLQQPGVALSSPATAAVLAVAIAAPATAQTAPTGGAVAPVQGPATGAVKAPGYTGKPSARQMETNKKAIKTIRSFAGQIAHGKLKNMLQEPFPATDESGFGAMNTPVTVPATSIITNMPGLFRADVVTGASIMGDPNYGDVRKITLSQGESPDGKTIESPYTKVEFNIDAQGYAGFTGEYVLPGEGKYEIDTSVVPSEPGVANLNASRLTRASKHFSKLLGLMTADLGSAQFTIAKPINPPFEIPGKPIGRVGEGQ